MTSATQTNVSAPDKQALRLHAAMHDAALNDAERQQARDDFFAMHFKLAMHIGRRILPHWGQNTEDLEQEAAVAICIARDRWTPERGSFGTLLDFYVRNRFKNWLRQQELIMRSHGAFEECGKRMRSGADPAEVGKKQVNSFNGNCWGDGDPRLMGAAGEHSGSEVADPNSAFEEDLDMSIAVHQCVSALPSHERKVVEQYYGLRGGEPKTLRETADQLHCSHEQVRLLLLRACKSLRTTLQGSVS